MVKINKEYIEKEYNQAIKEYNAALTEDDLDTARRTMKRLEAIAMQDYFLQSSFFIASSYSFSTILEFLFDDKFDTGYLSASLNWLKFNVYISQFINF